MSVGHISRAAETAGISTVVIASAAFKAKLVSMAVPRLLLTNRIMGRPIGFPGDVDFQNAVLNQALELLESAPEGGTCRQLTD